MTKEIVFPESLFRAIDEVHEKATKEFGNISPEAKELATKRNEANAIKNKTTTPENNQKSGNKFTI